jgi:nicotinamidase-related amidase
VIVVDMQNDFGSRGGMFHRAGIDISMIQRAVAPTGRGPILRSSAYPPAWPREPL